MKPLIVLISVFLVTSGVLMLTPAGLNLMLAANISMSAMLFFTAIGHFKFTKGMAMMIPSFIPYKTPLVYLTGLAEIAFGCALLIPFCRINTVYVLIVFYTLMLPANIYAAIKKVNYEQADNTGPGLKYLWFRVPEQVFFIAWLYLFNIGLQ